MSLNIKGEAYLTPEELAAGLGVQPTTLGKWRSERRGPAYLGGRPQTNKKTFWRAPKWAETIDTITHYTGRTREQVYRHLAYVAQREHTRTGRIPTPPNTITAFCEYVGIDTKIVPARTCK